MKRLKNKIIDQRGVTLLEMIVAMAIFSITMLSVALILNMIMESQYNSLAAQDTQEGMKYAMEYMSKEIRAGRGSDGDCASVLFDNASPVWEFKVFNIYPYPNSSDQALFFRNKDSKCVAYFLENNRLKVRKQIVGNCSDLDGCVENYLIPQNISISNLKFAVQDEVINTSPRMTQPTVTLSFDINEITKQGFEQSLKMQTTVGTRYYE